MSAGLFSDMRKTAIGAGVLLLLALFFAEPGGVGGRAVDHAVPARDPVGASARARSAGGGWFSVADESPEPSFTPPALNGGAVPGSEAAAAIAAARPVGPDFPAELTRPRYSSSAAGP